jgi:hypothetical protein
MVSPHGYPPAGYFGPAWSNHTDPRSTPGDPRSSPPPTGGSLDDFCTKFNLGDTVRGQLETLGFEVGDNLSAVKEVHWERAGFAPLTWNRVVKAHTKYKKSLCEM